MLAGGVIADVADAVVAVEAVFAAFDVDSSKPRVSAAVCTGPASCGGWRMSGD
jgi:hypothetical protein